MTEKSPVLEHSVDANVDLVFAWSHRTDISTWSDPPATFALDGPFAVGSQGTTVIPGQEPLRWRIAEVRSERSFTIEMQLDGATLAFEWLFEARTARTTRLTQRIVLSGPNAAAYRPQIEKGFGPALADGMRRLASAMEAAAR
jgi:hypothetical protein